MIHSATGSYIIDTTDNMVVTFSHTLGLALSNLMMYNITNTEVTSLNLVEIFPWLYKKRNFLEEWDYSSVLPTAHLETYRNKRNLTELTMIHLAVLARWSRLNQCHHWVIGRLFHSVMLTLQGNWFNRNILVDWMSDINEQLLRGL
jgi:hypothetical protein